VLIHYELLGPYDVTFFIRARRAVPADVSESVHMRGERA
jgi:hypothetical protein